MDMFAYLYEQLETNFFAQERYVQYFKGLGVTLEVSFAAMLIGLLIGATAALMCLTEKNGKVSPWSIIAKAYIDIIRGTPVVLQVLIIYNIIFASVHVSKVLVGCIAFGINSGAYVSEIIRAGIMAVDKGQTEAGRSLGLSSSQTMKLIVLPQAIKNVLPALVNEFIVLIKETAIIGYIALVDLTKAADFVISRTLSYTPLILAGIIYFIIIKILTLFARSLERRLRRSDCH